MKTVQQISLVWSPLNIKCGLDEFIYDYKMLSLTLLRGIYDKAIISIMKLLTLN